MGPFGRRLFVRYGDPLHSPYGGLDVYSPLHKTHGLGPRVVRTPEFMPYPEYLESEPEHSTSARIRRKYLDPETLDRNCLSWEVDKYDPKYIIITQYWDGDFQNTLLALTKCFKKRSKRAKRGCPVPGLGSHTSSPSNSPTRYHSTSRSRRRQDDPSTAGMCSAENSVSGYRPPRVDTSENEASTARRGRSRGRSSAVASINDSAPWSPLHNSTHSNRREYADPDGFSSKRPSDSEDNMRGHTTIQPHAMESSGAAAARAARRIGREPGNIVIEVNNPGPETGISIKNNLDRGVHVILRQNTKRYGSRAEASTHIEAGGQRGIRNSPKSDNPSLPRCSRGTRPTRRSARTESISDEAPRSHLSMNDYFPGHQRSFRRTWPLEEDLASLRVLRDDGNPNPNFRRAFLDSVFRPLNREQQRRSRDTQPRLRRAGAPRVVFRNHGPGDNIITGEINDSTGEIFVRMPGGQPVIIPSQGSYKVKGTGSKSPGHAGMVRQPTGAQSIDPPATSSGVEAEINDKEKGSVEDDSDVKGKGRTRAATVTEEAVIAKDFGVEGTPIVTTADRDGVEAGEGPKQAEDENLWMVMG